MSGKRGPGLGGRVGRQEDLDGRPFALVRAQLRGRHLDTEEAHRSAVRQLDPPVVVHACDEDRVVGAAVVRAAEERPEAAGEQHDRNEA